MRTEQEILDTIIKLANKDERIRAVYLFGSRANPDIRQDIYQDYDISFTVTETESFQSNKNWLNTLGDITFLVEGERNALIFFESKDMSVLSRRCVFNVFFDDSICMDLAIEIKEETEKNFSKYKPNKILIDKDNLLSQINIIEEIYIGIKPNENMYQACCSNFWWFLLYPIKGIARNKIPFAMVSFNTFTRTLLNKMIEWYIGVQTNFSISIGKRERDYEKYLSEDIHNLYVKTYIEKNYWDIVLTTCNLFNKLAMVVGKHFNFKYNQKEEDCITKYLHSIKAEKM